MAKRRFGYITVYCSTADAPPSPQCHFTICSPECATEELFLQALCEEDSEDDYTEADPVLDDLHFRRMQQTLHQTSANLHYDRFLPQYWTPEEEVRVRRIYLGSQRRPWYHKMQRLRSVSFIIQSSVNKEICLKLIQNNGKIAVLYYLKLEIIHGLLCKAEIK